LNTMGRPRSTRSEEEIDFPEELDQNPALRRQIQRGRAGQRALQKAIAGIISRGPVRLCDSLNIYHVHASRFGFPEQGLWALSENLNLVLLETLDVRNVRLFKDGSPVLLGPIWQAMACIRAMVDAMIKERHPRCAHARLILKWKIAEFRRLGNQFMRAAKRELRKAASPDYPRGFSRVFSLVALGWHFDQANDLMLEFWTVPEDWISRLRKCGYAACEKPYFLDRAPAGHARFCSDQHRVSAYRASRK
jgi:hypothetical protein